MISDPARSRVESPATPILGIVSPPADYLNDLAQATVGAGETDLLSRLMFMQQAHKTYAGTSTVCTGVASRIPGTVVHEVTRSGTRDRAVLRIGHPAGVIETETCVEAGAGGFVVRRATLGRTARRILEGYVFVPDAG